MISRRSSNLSWFQQQAFPDAGKPLKVGDQLCILTLSIQPSAPELRVRARIAKTDASRERQAEEAPKEEGGSEQ